MRRFAKVLGAIVLSSTIIFGNADVNVKAAYDYESNVNGFQVDTDYYKTSCWYNTITANVKLDGNIIGTNMIDIGVVRAKTKATNGDYFDHVMVRCAMKGKNPKSGYCGYSEHLTLEAKLPSGVSLQAFSPESEAGMKTYDIGLSVDSDKTVGLSASTSVTKNALEVNQYSDPDIRLFKVCYDYIHYTARWNWKTYGTYAYNTSYQRAHYVAKTSKYSYNTDIVVKSKFQRWDRQPGYWATQYEQYATLNYTITFASPK